MIYLSNIQVIIKCIPALYDLFLQNLVCCLFDKFPCFRGIMLFKFIVSLKQENSPVAGNTGGDEEEEEAIGYGNEGRAVDTYPWGLEELQLGAGLPTLLGEC